MLLLHPLLTCTDAGPDLCTFCPDLCTLHPDLCTLHLWCHPSINWHTSTPLAHMVVVTGCNLHWWRYSFSHWHKHSCTSGDVTHCNLSGGLFPSTHWCTYSTCAGATCTVRCWSMVVVDVYGQYIYIHIYIYIYTYRQRWRTSRKCGARSGSPQ